MTAIVSGCYVVSSNRVGKDETGLLIRLARWCVIPVRVIQCCLWRLIWKCLSATIVVRVRSELTGHIQPATVSE